MQVHPLVQSFERLLELGVLRAVFVNVAADRVELLEPVVDHGPDVSSQEPARPQPFDQDERGQRLQGISGELAAGENPVSWGMMGLRGEGKVGATDAGSRGGHRADGTIRTPCRQSTANPVRPASASGKLVVTITTRHHHAHVERRLAAPFLGVYW